MQTAAQRRRLRPSATFILTLALSALLSQAAFGQDAEAPEERSIAEQVQELAADLEARRTALQELQEKVEKVPGTAAAVILEKEISDRRARFRRDLTSLVGLVVDAEDAGAEAAQGRSLATELIRADALSMHESLEQNGKESLALLDVMAKGTAEEAQEARGELTKALSVSTRLIKYLDGNIDERERLKLDVGADSEYLSKRVQLRADVTAGLLQRTKEEIDELVARPGIDEDTEGQKELASLKKQLNVLAESQSVNVDVMDEYGLDSAELRQGIIVATGKLSQDILNRKVASGLIEAWIADGKDWLRSNGASVIFQTLAFLLVLFAFWFAARIGRGLTRRALDRSSLNVSSLAREFFIKMTGRLILLFGFIIAIAQLGIEVGPLLAGLGIAGFIIGFALQDTLSNFASGMLILIYRPFDVGDVIEAGGGYRQGRHDEPRVDDGAHVRQPNAGRAQQADLERRHSERDPSGQATRRHDVRHWILGRCSEGRESSHGNRHQLRTGIERSGAGRSPSHPWGFIDRFHRSALGENRRLLGCVLARDPRGEAAIRRRRHFDPLSATRRTRLPRGRRRRRSLALRVLLSTLTFAEPDKRFQ